MFYRIADLLVEMSPGGRTAAQAEVYRTSAVGRSADIGIRVDGASALAQCPELETEDMAEYIATGDCFAVGLLRNEGMMLHASAVEYGGRAVCFSAPPGTGKSTHAERWARLFGASILNDDKPALVRQGGSEPKPERAPGRCLLPFSGGGERPRAADAGPGIAAAAEPDAFPAAPGGYGTSADNGGLSPAGDKGVPADLPE